MQQAVHTNNLHFGGWLRIFRWCHRNHYIASPSWVTDAIAISTTMSPIPDSQSLMPHIQTPSPDSMRITRRFRVAFAVCVFVFGGPATAVGIKIVRILSWWFVDLHLASPHSNSTKIKQKCNHKNADLARDGYQMCTVKAIRKELPHNRNRVFKLFWFCSYACLSLWFCQLIYCLRNNFIIIVKATKNALCPP